MILTGCIATIHAIPNGKVPKKEPRGGVKTVPHPERESASRAVRKAGDEQGAVNYTCVLEEIFVRQPWPGFR